MPEVTRQVLRARRRWHWVGRRRPSWADEPGAGQESVWDFPRPPRVEAVGVRLRVEHAGVIVAETDSGLRILETAGAPSYYFPRVDVDETRIVPAEGSSFCEWKGAASHFDVCGSREAAWSYADPFPEFTIVRGWMAFHPARVDACWLGELRATPQPGGYYGGWVTLSLAGPIKGGPGSGSW